jgi:NitT/TauT family transport system ATP-binding protein
VGVDLSRGRRSGRAAQVASGDGSVELHDLEKVFFHSKGAVEVFRDISCTFPAGEFVSLLGPSGCGKSTLLRLIGGLTTPTSGHVIVDGQVVTRPPDSVGMVFQEDALLEWRTVLKNVMLPAEIRKSDSLPMGEAKERARELLQRVGLGGFLDAWPSQLSGGMKQRVALCQAMLRRPRLLLMDEPFGALDALTREQMQQDLQELWLAERSSVVLVTHSISEAVLLSDRVLVFSQRPARIIHDFKVDLPRPRDEKTSSMPEFQALTQTVYDLFRQEGILK